jgi:hypothetical protein
MSEMIQTAFDYGGPPDQPPPHLREPVHGEVVDTRWDESLSPDTREFVQLKTDEIHGQIQRTAEGIIKIGQNLTEVQERLREENKKGDTQGNGTFEAWLKAEFDMSRRTAFNLMAVAHKFGGKSATVALFPPKVLYELATASDQVIQKVEVGEIPATLEEIRAEKRRANEAERAKQEVEQQLQRLRASMTVLQRQLEEQPQVIEKTVENPETEAELARLREKYAATEAQLKIKTERVKVLSEEIRLHDQTNQQERYNEQIRFKWRQACDAFHLGINQAITRMVTPLDAASAFVSDDWARLASVESTLKRALEALKGLRESVSRQFVEGSVEK